MLPHPGFRASQKMQGKCVSVMGVAFGRRIAVVSRLMVHADDLPIRVKRAIHKIVQYTARHPEARDTLEGIRDWWLPPGENDYTLAELQEALQLLLEWGWLVKHKFVEQTIVYGVSEVGLPLIAEFLANTEDGGQ
jgi:hypothetical protein